MSDAQDSKDTKVEVVEGQQPVKPVDVVSAKREVAASEVLVGAEGGNEEEKVREALKKRFVLLAEDDPGLEVLLDEFKTAGGEQMIQAWTLEGVKKETDNFIARVEAGDLDQTILTMIADLEYPYRANGPAVPFAGIKGIEYVRDAVVKYNEEHPDKPLKLEIILNSTRANDFLTNVQPDAISVDKESAVKKLLELVKEEVK